MRYLKIVAISIAILLGFAGVAIGIAAIGGKFNQKPIQLTEIYFSEESVGGDETNKALHKYAVIEKATTFVVSYLPSNATNRVINVTIVGGNKSIFENVPSAITGGAPFTLTPAKYDDGYNKTGSILLKFENPYCSTECYLHIAIDQTISNTKVEEDGKTVDCFNINTSIDESGKEIPGLAIQDNSTLGPTYLMNSSSMMKNEEDPNKGGRILWVKSNFLNAVDPDTGTAFPAQGDDGGTSTLYNPILFSLVSRNDGMEERIEANDIKLTQTYDEATRSYMLRLTSENRQTKQFYLKMQMHRSYKLKSEFENSGFNDFKSKFNDMLDLETNQEYKDLCGKFKTFINKYYSVYFKPSDENNNNFIKNEIIDSSSDSYALNTIIKAIDIVMVTQYQSFRIIDINVNNFMFNSITKKWEFNVFGNENTTIDDVSGLSSSALTSKFNLSFDIAGKSSDLTDEQFKNEIKLLKSNVKITPVVWDSKNTDSKLSIANLISQNSNAEYIYQNENINNSETNPFKIVNAGKTEYKTGFLDGSNFIEVIRNGNEVKFVPKLPSKLYSKDENTFKIYLVFSIETVDKDGNNKVFYNYIEVVINRDSIIGNLKVKEPKEMIVNSEYLNANVYAGKTQSLEYSIESELMQYKTVKIFADEASIKIGTDLSKINIAGKNKANLIKYENFNEDEKITYKDAENKGITLIELGTITYDDQAQIGVEIEAICAQFNSPVKLYAVLILTDKDGNPIDRDGKLLYQTVDENGKIKIIDNNGKVEYKDGEKNVYYDFSGKNLDTVDYYTLAWSTEPTDLKISSVVDNIYFYTYIEEIGGEGGNYNALYLDKKENKVKKVEGGKFFLRNNRYDEIDGAFTNLKLISGEDYNGTLIFTFNPLAIDKIDGLADASSFTDNKFTLNFNYGLTGTDDATKKLNSIYQNNHIEAIKKLLSLIGQNESGGYDLIKASMSKNSVPLNKDEIKKLLKIISVKAIKNQNDDKNPVVGFEVQIKSNSDFGVSPTAQIKISDKFIDVYRNVISEKKVLDKFNVMSVVSATYGINDISQFSYGVDFLDEEGSGKKDIDIVGKFNGYKVKSYYQSQSKFAGYYYVENGMDFNHSFIADEEKMKEILQSKTDIGYSGTTCDLKYCYYYMIGSSINTIINESDLNISNYSFVDDDIINKNIEELSDDEKKLLEKHKYNIIDPSVNFQNAETNEFYKKLSENLKGNDSPLQLTLYAYGEDISGTLENIFESDSYELINPDEGENAEKLLENLRKNVFAETGENKKDFNFYKITLTTDKRLKLNKDYVANNEEIKLAIVYDFDLTRTFENPTSSFIKSTKLKFSFREPSYYKNATANSWGDKIIFEDGVANISLPKEGEKIEGNLTIDLLGVNYVDFKDASFGDGYFSYRKVSGSEDIELTLTTDTITKTETEQYPDALIRLEIPEFNTEGGKSLVYEIVFNFADGGGAKKIIFTLEIQPNGSYSLNKNYFYGATEELPNSNPNNWFGFDADNKLVLLDGGFSSLSEKILSKNTSAITFEASSNKITYDFAKEEGFYSAGSDTIVYKIKDNSLNSKLADKIKIQSGTYGTKLEVEKLLTDAEFVLEIYKRIGGVGPYDYEKKTEVKVKVVAKDKIVLKNLSLTTGENGANSYYIANKAFNSGDSVVDDYVKLLSYTCNEINWSQNTTPISDFAEYINSGNIKVFGEIKTEGSDKGQTELYDKTGSLGKNKYVINGKSVYDLYFERNNTTNLTKNIFENAGMQIENVDVIDSPGSISSYNIVYNNLETELVAPIRITFNGLTQYGDSVDILIPLLTYKLGVDANGTGANYAYDSDRDNLKLDGIGTVASYDNSTQKYIINLNTMGAGNNALGNFFGFKIMQLFSNYEAQFGLDNISVVPVFDVVDAGELLPPGVSFMNNELIIGDGFSDTIELKAVLDYYVLNNGSAEKIFSISGVKIELGISDVPMRLYYNSNNVFGNELSFSSQKLSYTTNDTKTQLIPIISILNLPNNINLGDIFEYKKISATEKESFSSFKIKEIKLINGTKIDEKTDPSVDKIGNYITIGNAATFTLNIVAGKENEIAEFTIEAISSDENIYHINYVARLNKDVDLTMSEIAINLNSIVSCSTYEIYSMTLFNDKIYKNSNESDRLKIDEYLKLSLGNLTCLKDGIEKVVIKAIEDGNEVYIDLFAKEIKIVNDLSTIVLDFDLNNLNDKDETSLNYEIFSIYMFDGNTIGGVSLNEYASISDFKLSILKQNIQTIKIKMQKYNRKDPIIVTIDAPYLEETKYGDLSKLDNINLNIITGLEGANYKLNGVYEYFSINHDSTLKSTEDNQEEIELVSNKGGKVNYVKIINNTIHKTIDLSKDKSFGLNSYKPKGVSGTISNINVLEMYVAGSEITTGFNNYVTKSGSNLTIVVGDVDYIAVTFKVGGVDCYAYFYNDSTAIDDLSRGKSINLNGYTVSDLTCYNNNISSSDIPNYISNDGNILQDGVTKITLTKSINNRTCKKTISTTMVEYYYPTTFNGTIESPQLISTISLIDYRIAEIKDGGGSEVLQENYDVYAKIEGDTLKCYSHNISSIILTKTSGGVTYKIKVSKTP